MTPAAGIRLGRYTLKRKLGVGGMADVWEAFDETLHRNVAVKVIRESISSSPDFAERFVREARLAAGLEHPNILPIYDFGRDDETAYLVMPILPGGSLKDAIRENGGPLPPGIAVEYLAGIASALDHAHARGILHRDVKPANVLVDQTGNLLLADFGLAKSSTAGSSGLTQTGMILGTPLYMSPEQAIGQTLDARSDQYAVAVIAFEILTGSVPFSAESPLTVLHKHLQEAPPIPSGLNPSLPPQADAVLIRALAKRPEERFTTCTELVVALADSLGVAMPKSRSRISGPPTLPTAGMGVAMDQTPTVRSASGARSHPSGATQQDPRTGSTAAVSHYSQPTMPASAIPPSHPTSMSGPPSLVQSLAAPQQRSTLVIGLLGGLLLGLLGLVAFLITQRTGTNEGATASPTLPPQPPPATPVAQTSPQPTAPPVPTEPTTSTVSIVELAPTATPAPRPTATPRPSDGSQAERRPTRPPDEPRDDGDRSDRGDRTDRGEKSGGRYTLEGKEPRTVDVTIPYRPNEKVPVGVQIGDAIIKSFEMEGPTRSDFEDAERKPSDTFKSKIVYTYTNRDDRDYKCKYTATIIGANGQTLGSETTTRSLNKEQVNDTNGSSVKMKTLDYKEARSVRLRFEVRKD